MLRNLTAPWGDVKSSTQPLPWQQRVNNFRSEARANRRGRDEVCGLMRRMEEHLGIEVRVPRQSS